MKYKPVTAVWEITMGCNMRCKHCGSSCKESLPDELTTEEAFKVCDDVGALGLKWLTLSGGEPLTRKDWPLIAQRLRQNHVIPNIITNGWMITEEIADKAIESGIGTFAISLDGVRETHDFIRKTGSFDRIMAALELLKKKDITAGIITTITKKNITELPAIKQLLIDKGVTVWQIQIGLPMGTFTQNNEMLIQPEDIDRIIDFSFETVNDPRINIYLADCIGYYNHKEIQLRSKAYRSATPVLWEGCTAGKRSFGILQNGDILGCTSIRDRQYIEGNVRTTPLTEIWNNQDNFQWSRGLTRKDLDGLCLQCKYGENCLGGCPNTRLTMNGDIHSENSYCSYNFAMKQAIEKLENVSDVELSQLGKKFAQKGNLQLAEIMVSKALEASPNDIDLLSYYGYISFMLDNYDRACSANKKVLEMEPDNVYANKGMGLSLVRNGKLEEGIQLLEKSTQLTNASYMDPYYDLAVIYIENGKLQDARTVISNALQKSSEFSAAGASLSNMIQKAELAANS